MSTVLPSGGRGTLFPSTCSSEYWLFIECLFPPAFHLSPLQELSFLNHDSIVSGAWEGGGVSSVSHNFFKCHFIVGRSFSPLQHIVSPVLACFTLRLPLIVMMCNEMSIINVLLSLFSSLLKCGYQIMYSMMNNWNAVLPTSTLSHP